MTVRKNFLFEENVAQHLEEIAKVEGKTQTQITQEAIENRYRTLKQKKKLEALQKLAGSLTGQIKEISNDELRALRAHHRAK